MEKRLKRIRGNKKMAENVKTPEQQKAEEKAKREQLKRDIMHSGPCSSPYKDNCPCTNDCVLHGRCCDCVHNHIQNRINSGVVTDDTKWLVACMRLAHEGKFDCLYVHKNSEA